MFKLGSETATMMNSFLRISSWIGSHGRVSALFAFGIGVAVTCRRLLETAEARERRADVDRKKALRKLADRISSYGRKLHQRYPTGNVVVNVRDLAQQLRKQPDAVASALHLLLDEQKVERSALEGYWKITI
jgi:hypothetical protein